MHLALHARYVQVCCGRVVQLVFPWQPCTMLPPRLDHPTHIYELLALGLKKMMALRRPSNTTAYCGACSCVVCCTCEPTHFNVRHLQVRPFWKPPSTKHHAASYATINIALHILINVTEPNTLIIIPTTTTPQQDNPQ